MSDELPDAQSAVRHEIEWLESLLIRFDAARLILGLDVDSMTESQFSEHDKAYSATLNAIHDSLENVVLLGEDIGFTMLGCIELHQALNGEGEPADCLRRAKSEVNSLVVKLERIEADLNSSVKKVSSDGKSDSESQMNQDAYERVLREFDVAFASRESHKKCGQTMAEKISADDWNRYYEIASAKAKVNKDPASHFESKSKSRARNDKNNP